MKLAQIAAVAILAAATFFGIYWLFWLVWTAVMPQIWPTGPESLVSPSYWLFVGMGILLAFVASFFRARK